MTAMCLATDVLLSHFVGNVKGRIAGVLRSEDAASKEGKRKDVFVVVSGVTGM